MKKEIAVEEVWRIHEERWAINRLKFSNIIWTYQGKPLDIPRELLDDYELIGLNNCDFITSSYLPNKLAPWRKKLSKRQ